ncbi:MAG: very short patch repair endonuclease [Prevotella sp.]|jgi:DNA mismatch endonuclease (patch repair protein)
MDNKSKEDRSANMSSVHSKDTKPELLVRHYLWSRGFRYRVNSPRLPGHPDIVLRKYRACIFVNGCFWHGHEGCKYFKMPATNTDFWTRKITRNKERDREVSVKLSEMGWHTIVVWECELKGERREQTLTSLVYTLNRIWLEDHAARYPRLDEESGSMDVAAESMDATNLPTT